MEKPCTSRNPPCKVFRPEKPCRKSYPTASFFSFLNLGTALLWSLLWHRPFSDFLNFRTATSFEFGNGKDALQPKTISAKWCGNIPDSPDWVSGNVWKRNIAMVLGPRPPRGNSFQEKDSHSPDRPYSIFCELSDALIFSTRRQDKPCQKRPVRLISVMDSPI